jgi:hypothetical protein
MEETRRQDTYCEETRRQDTYCSKISHLVREHLRAKALPAKASDGNEDAGQSNGMM